MQKKSKSKGRFNLKFEDIWHEDHLLMPSLYTTVTAVQSCDVSILVTEQLNLEMSTLSFHHEESVHRLCILRN